MERREEMRGEKRKEGRGEEEIKGGGEGGHGESLSCEIMPARECQS